MKKQQKQVKDREAATMAIKKEGDRQRGGE